MAFEKKNAKVEEVLEAVETVMEAPTNEVSEVELLKARIAELEAEKAMPKEEVKEEKTVKEWLEERVPFYANISPDGKNDDIVVGINGTNWVIQRGKQVMIPRYVFQALEDSYRQEIEAYRASQAFADQYQRDISRLS